MLLYRHMFFFSLGYVPRGGIARSYSNCLQLYEELPGCFPSSCTIFLSHRFIRVSVSRHEQHLLLSDFLIIAILVDVKWYLMVVLSCIFLMINDIEHFFTYLLGICVSVLEKCLLRSFVQFKIGIFVLLLVSCRSYIYS